MTRSDSPCAELEQDLVLLHYGDLSADERRPVETHVKDCAVCARYLAELANLLPKTLMADEPPQAFWHDYTRELRHKISDLTERQPWWRKALSGFKPWALPALATTAVVALALTFTLGKSLWISRETPPPVDAAILEVMPMTENLDFFRNFEVLDVLDVLEQMDDPNKGAA